MLASEVADSLILPALSVLREISFSRIIEKKDMYGKYCYIRRPDCLNQMKYSFMEGCMAMATRSILTSVNIRGEKRTKEFIAALEQAKKKKGKVVVLSRTLREVGAEQIDDFISAIKK